MIKNLKLNRLPRYARNDVFKIGFTMIELLVVVIIFGIILVTISTILINTVKARNRTFILQQLENAGNMTLDRIKYNLLNAQPSTVLCSGNQVTFMDKSQSQNNTIISCTEGVKIASASADLASPELLYNPNGVVPTNCGGFVTCTIVAGEIKTIEIKFTLKAGDPGSPNIADSVGRDFQTSVTLRK